MADWAGLNNDILISIAERLPSVESYDSFAGVCKPWQQAAREGHINQTIFEGPWLMWAEEEGQEFREFSSVSLGINRTRKILLPEANKQRCVSYKDWLLMCSPDEIEATLLHPLSGVQIHLPKFTTLSNYRPTGSSIFLERALITANPATNSDYIVFISYGCGASLGFWKSGASSWTVIDHVSVEDMVYSAYDNKLYILHQDGRIFIFDIHGPEQPMIPKASRKIRGKFDLKSYLVELSEGKFLVVRRFLFLDDDDTQNYHTTGFTMFEVNMEENSHTKVNDLGNKALFVGHSTSYLIECSEFNKYDPNCIYFSDDYTEGYCRRGGGKDMGIYLVSDESIRPFFRDEIRTGIITPPIWIGPGF